MSREPKLLLADAFSLEKITDFFRPLEESSSQNIFIHIQIFLKELSQVILSYFGRVQNQL